MAILLMPLAIAFLLVLTLICPQVAAAPINSTENSGLENLACFKKNTLRCLIFKRATKEPKPFLVSAVRKERSEAPIGQLRDYLLPAIEPTN
ncbi:hypothetical protein BGZ54_004523 [Gamsiella multidivaricata]|nr:hypothetical protein BGZ54_004523 [Gamsiella multidivaricata]